MYLLILGLILLLCSLCFRRNAKLLILQLLYFWAVASFNNDNPDYYNYKNGFEHIYNYNGLIKEPLYWAFARITSTIGFDYIQFRILFFAISFSILGYAIWKLSVIPNCILGLYFIYPFTIDVIQMRSLMAGALFLLSINYLNQYNNDRENNDLYLSLLFIGLAIGFHFSSLATLIVYLGLLKKERIFNNLMVVILICVVGLITWIIFDSRILGLLNEFGIVEKASIYTASTSHIGGYLVSLFILRACFIILCYLALHAKKKDYSARSLNVDSFLFNVVCLLSMFALFEVFVSMEFERIVRLGFIIGLIMISNCLPNMNTSNSRVYISLTGIYLIVLYYLIYFVHMSGSSSWFEYTFLPIFNNSYSF